MPKESNTIPDSEDVYARGLATKPHDLHIYRSAISDHRKQQNRKIEGDYNYNSIIYSVVTSIEIVISTLNNQGEEHI